MATIEQQRAIALAKARLRMQSAPQGFDPDAPPELVPEDAVIPGSIDEARRLRTQARDQRPSLSPFSGPTLKEMGREPTVVRPGVMVESAARTLGDNALSSLDAAGEVLGTGLAGTAAVAQTTGQRLSGMFDMTTGEPTGLRGLWDQFSTNFDEQTQMNPARLLMSGNTAPTTFDLQAAAEVAPIAAFQHRTPEEFGQPVDAVHAVNDIGQQFSQRRDQALEGFINRRAEEPGMAFIGDTMGDAATLWLGRMPFVKATRQRRIDEARRQFNKEKQPQQFIEPSVRRGIDRRKNAISEWFDSSGYRIGEAGIEGAMLAAMNDEDPVNNAMMAAGSQIAGNLSSAAWKKVPGKSPLIKAAILIAGTTAGIQIFDSYMPGGDDYILPNIETSANKTAAFLGIGALLAFSGFSNRSNTVDLDDFGVFADAFNASRRGASMSLMSELVNNPDMQQIAMKFVEDPNYFGPTAARRLARAANVEDVSFSETIDSLMKDRKFKQAVDEMMVDRQFRRDVNALEGEQ